VATLDQATKLSAVRQVADRLQVLAATRPSNPVTIELNPQGLGTVSLTVKGIGKAVTAELSASNEAVRSALSEGRANLTSSLEQRGFTVSQLTVRDHVAAAQGGSGANPGGTGRQDQPSSQQQQHASTANSFGHPGAASGGSNGHRGSTHTSAAQTTATEDFTATETDPTPRSSGLDLAI
jgi:flagellar hook-length control protein FliK